MVIFKRTIEKVIKDSLFKGRMIAVLGPRQSGKTTMVKAMIDAYGSDGAYWDCQLAEVRRHFVVGKPDELLALTNGKKIVVFDEAQTIQDIGAILKSFHDANPGVQIIATGSSSFDLSNKIKEPMTGRIFEFILYPLSLSEVKGSMTADRYDLDELMLYGSYPAVVAADSSEEKKLVLKNIATQYLYKDVFIFEAIRNPRVFEDMVKLLALQMGSLVSVNELAEQLGVSRSVVQRYLRLLEQAFIVKVVHSFSNNPRTELKKAFKVYFLDTGVRNALVDIDSPMTARKDAGHIFEGYFLSERMKEGSNDSIFPPEIMFWRTRSGLEIDIIEKKGAAITAYECKLKDKDFSFASFKRSYPQATTRIITPEDLL
ncbi:MAG: ATP-binding protein [Patescibacteria group bacterium]|nr:ATP-binding protein [Patescibacteria group bacterium]